MKRTILIRFFLVAFLVILPQAALAQTLPSQAFDDYVNQAMKDWEVPGMTIAVIKDDRIVFAHGYGVRELGKPAPVDENTLFAIGSSSKAFTAAALAMLVDEGKLKWEDPATKYLPGFQLFDPYSTRELTVSDLITHRSGLSRGDMLWYASPYDRAEVLRRVRYLKPTWSLRARFGYQNIMFLAAGEIIPSVTKKSWDDFVRERIFTPLGMKSTNTSIRSLENAADVASPHSKIDNKVRPVAWRNIDNIAPAGSINSTVVDMAQWVRLQLGGGNYQNQRLLSAAVVKEMQSPQTVIRLEGQMASLYPEAHFLNYGMGWFLSDYRGKKLVEHGGAIDGMRAEVAMIPEEKMGVVVLTNLGGTIFPHALMYKVFDSYLGVPAKDWCADLLKVTKGLEQQAKTAEQKAENERVKGTSPSLALEKYAGKYQSEMYGEATLAVENGKLVLHFGPHFTGDLEHWNYDTFRVVWRDPMEGKGFINFRLSTSAKVDWMNVAGLAEFTRVPDTPPASSSTGNQ
jgi:CubicO group peptidase (beta-lactamase class C family)